MIQSIQTRRENRRRVSGRSISVVVVVVEDLTLVLVVVEGRTLRWSSVGEDVSEEVLNIIDLDISSSASLIEGRVRRSTVGLPIKPLSLCQYEERQEAAIHKSLLLSNSIKVVSKNYRWAVREARVAGCLLAIEGCWLSLGFLDWNKKCVIILRLWLRFRLGVRLEKPWKEKDYIIMLLIQDLAF